MGRREGRRNKHWDEGGIGSSCSLGTECCFGMLKSSGDGQGWLLTGECPWATEIHHLEMVKRANSKLFLFYHNFSNWTKDLNRHFPKEAVSRVGKKMSDGASGKSVAQSHFFYYFKNALVAVFSFKSFHKAGN